MRYLEAAAHNIILECTDGTLRYTWHDETLFSSHRSFSLNHDAGLNAIIFHTILLE